MPLMRTPPPPPSLPCRGARRRIDAAAKSSPSKADHQSSDPRRCPGQACHRDRAGTAVAVGNGDWMCDDRQHCRTGGLQQAPRQHDNIGWLSSPQVSSRRPSMVGCRAESVSLACSMHRSHGRVSNSCWGSRTDQLPRSSSSDIPIITCSAVRVLPGAQRGGSAVAMPPP
jgi:hypothetical protein